MSDRVVDKIMNQRERDEAKAESLSKSMEKEIAELLRGDSQFKNKIAKDMNRGVTEGMHNPSISRKSPNPHGTFGGFLDSSDE